MGFTTATTVNDVAGTTCMTSTGGWNADNRYTPTFMNMTVTLMDNSSSTTHTAMGYHAIPDSINYFLTKDTVTVTDYDGNTETIEYCYDLGKGVVTKQKTYPDGNSTLMYKETESADFVKKAGQWFPRMIYTRQKHKDDPLEFNSTRKIAYDSFGLPDTVIVNFNTPLELMTTYTYDQWGNTLSETTSGSGLNTVTKHYEYDSSHRFMTRN